MTDEPGQTAAPRGFCTSCGTPLAGSPFCTGCGARVAPPAAPPAAVLAGDPLGAPQPAVPPRGRRRLVVAAVAAVVLIAAAGGGFALLRDRGGDEVQPRAAVAKESPSPRPSRTPAPRRTRTPAPPPTTPVGTLRIGSLLPETGNLAFLGPPSFAGVDLAVRDINAAGGLLGEDLVHLRGDSGDLQNPIAGSTVTRLLDQDVSVIVGALSSGVTFDVIDQVAAAGVTQISPANTSPDLTSYGDRGLYFRTSPSDLLQGKALAEQILADGHRTVAVLEIADPYGESLGAAIRSTLTQSGASASAQSYDSSGDFRAEAAEVAQIAPDAVVVVGFEETSTAISALVDAGVGPQSTPLYLVDGNLGNALGEELPAGTLTGVQGILPGAEATDQLRRRLLQVDPALSDFSYAAESYDAVVTSALAAMAARSTSGVDIAAALPNVTKRGTACSTFAACRDLLAAGKDIDYDGESGRIELSTAGDPTQATFGIYTYGGDNRLRDDVRYVTAEQG